MPAGHRRYAPIIALACARFVADEQGATAIEYAMIAAGIGAAVAATVIEPRLQPNANFYDKIGAICSTDALAIAPAFSPAGISLVPSASASRVRAEPGASGFCWLSCGAQPESQTISKVARMRPSRIGEALGVDFHHPPQASRA